MHKIVSTKDDKAYANGIIKPNQDYVMSQSAYSGSSKKRDPEQLEQLASRLRYAEESIA